MKAAIYARCSTDEVRQEIDNQLIPLRKFASALEMDVVKEYIDYASGGNSNRPEFQNMLSASKRHEFDIILVWALDRFSREGILNTLGYIKSLRSNNVAIKSLQEPWMDTRDEGMGELLLAIFSWVANQEKRRISERIKAALRNKKNVGKRGKDKKPRRRSGYNMRWIREKTSPQIETVDSFENPPSK